MRILLVSHGYPPESGGGSERCVRFVAQGLREAHEVGVLYRTGDGARDDHEVRESEDQGVRLFAVSNRHRRAPGFEAYRDPHVTHSASGVLDRFAPDLVHVHHLNGLSTGVVFEARRRGAPVVITLHDFWPACPLGQLLNLREEVCPGPTPRRCLGCVGGQVAFRPRAVPSPGPPAAALPAWLYPLAGLASRALPWASARIAERLETMREVLRAADLVVAPSRFVAERLSALGFGRIAVLPNAREPLGTVARRPAADGRVRFGFLGAAIPSKGVHVLAEAFRRLRDPRASLEIHGPFLAYHGDVGYEMRVSGLLRGVPGAESALRGRYPHDGLPGILAGLDVVVVPSLWEENAPLTVEEAFAARLPVVASDHGGLRERVRAGIDGLLFRPGDASDLTLALRRLLDEPGLRESLGRDPILAPSLGDHLNALEMRYAEARERFARRAGRVGVVVVDRGRPEDTAAAVASAADARVAPKVVVVENGPGPAPSLPAGVELLRLAENRGFAGGANAGIARLREAGCDRVLLLNNDARLEPGALGRLAEAVEDPGVAAAGPIVLGPEGRVESRGLRLDGVSGRARLVGHGEPRPESEGCLPVEGLSGAALMLRLSALERVGPLDELYFHSFEDTDWCVRARRAGLALHLVLGARARHASGATLGASPDRLYYAARNHLRAAERLHPLPGAGRVLRALAILAQNLAHVARQGEVPRCAGVRAVLDGYRDFRRGRFGPRAA